MLQVNVNVNMDRGNPEAVPISMNCWNCADSRHRYPDCPQPRKLFCLICGWPNVDKRSCPRPSCQVRRTISRSFELRDVSKTDAATTRVYNELSEKLAPLKRPRADVLLLEQASQTCVEYPRAPEMVDQATQTEPMLYNPSRLQAARLEVTRSLYRLIDEMALVRLDGLPLSRPAAEFFSDNLIDLNVSYSLEIPSNLEETTIVPSDADPSTPEVERPPSPPTVPTTIVPLDAEPSTQEVERPPSPPVVSTPPLKRPTAEELAGMTLRESIDAQLGPLPADPDAGPPSPARSDDLGFNLFN